MIAAIAGPPAPSATLTVIVPFADVESLFDGCLSSLARQTLTDVHVIMVNAGSADGSAAIAESMAGRDARFTIAEDRAGAVAGGVRSEYLAFADPRDLLVPDAYERLVASLARSGADVALGQAHGARRGPGGTRLRPRGDVRLFRDRRAGGPTGMVLRRAFWNRAFAGLDLGERPGACVGALACALARTVDVLGRPVIARQPEPPSLVARAPDIVDLRERLAAALAVRGLLPRGARREFDGTVLCPGDVAELLGALPRADDGSRRELAAIGSAVAAELDPRAVRALPAIRRLALHLLAQGRLSDLLEVLRHERLGHARSDRVVRRGRRRYAEHPFFRDPARRVPDSVYDVTDELTPVVRVDEIRWADDGLRLEGHAYIRGLESAGSEIRVWLAGPRPRRVRLAPGRTSRPDVTAESGQAAACHDESGFAVTVGYDVLRRLGRRPAPEWSLLVQVTAQGLTRRQEARGPKAGRAGWPGGRTVTGDVRLQPMAGPGRFRLLVRRRRTVVTAHRRIGAVLELTGRASGEPGQAAALVLSREPPAVEVGAAVEPTRRTREGYEFIARLRPAELRSGGDGGSHGGGTWSVRVAGGGRVFLDADPSEAAYPHGDGELRLTRTERGHLCVIDGAPRPTVIDAAWTEDDDVLTLAGRYAVTPDDRPRALVLRRSRSNEEHELPIVWGDDGAFTIAVEPDRMKAGDLGGAWGRGTWDVLMRSAGGDVQVRVARDSIHALPGWHDCADFRVATDVRDGDGLRLRVREPLADDERGPYARRRTQTVDYPRYRSRPLRDLVVFDAYLGRRYGCNPRAVFEELRRRDTGLECVWVCADGGFGIPGLETVQLGGRTHAEALARAKVLIGNFNQREWFAKRDGQLYVQCWHGTPLKKIGYDILDLPLRRTHDLSWYEYDIPQWDLLVAQTPFSTPIYRKAFRYDREILEAGHPRNDVLLSPERDRIAAETRRRLGIGAGQRVVLYAPTWRDDRHYGTGHRAFDLEFDLAAAAGALGPDHVILVRTHYLITDRPSIGSEVIDVSAYPDIADLYLAADVLVTDYSSAMFDFAVTRKPMVFYAYDLERYRDHVRGFYFDLEAEAPGPVLRTGDEVIDALRSPVSSEGFPDAPAVGAYKAYKERYLAFTEKFCPLDDGHASERVVDRILEVIR